MYHMEMILSSLAVRWDKYQTSCTLVILEFYTCLDSMVKNSARQKDNDRCSIFGKTARIQPPLGLMKWSQKRRGLITGVK